MHRAVTTQQTPDDLATRDTLPVHTSDKTQARDPGTKVEASACKRQPVRVPVNAGNAIVLPAGMGGRRAIAITTRDLKTHARNASRDVSGTGSGVSECHRRLTRQQSPEPGALALRDPLVTQRTLPVVLPVRACHDRPLHRSMGID